MSTSTNWVANYSAWRHGGWYVNNVRHVGGAVGCVSRNYPDRKWRIVCDDRRSDLGHDSDITFPTRDAAARAEHALAQAEISAELQRWARTDSGRLLCLTVGDSEVRIIANGPVDAATAWTVYTWRDSRSLNCRSTECFEQALGWGRDAAREIADGIARR